MSAIETEIAKGKRRRKLLAVVITIGIATLVVAYAGWMLLTKGFSLTVLPDDAAQTQQFAVKRGNAFFIDNKLYVIGREADVIISAQKYRSATLIVDDSSPANLKVELQPLPASVIISTSPALGDTQWMINGQPAMQAETFDAELVPGQYTITARHPAYEVASLTLDAQKAQQITQSMTLTPVQGEIRIQSTPAGAEVSLDGAPQGQTPVNMTQVGGQYAVTVKKAGYQVITDTVSVTSSTPTPARHYRLQPEQARVTVSVTPAGGALLVNGAPESSPVSIDANSETTFRYEKAGYLPQHHALSLSPGESRTLTFELQPEVGEVRVEASQQASVEVNGKSQGTTPLTLSLQALPTRIDIKKPGYRTVSQTVTPSRNKTAMVRAQMLREFDARRREGQPLFVSGLGIQLVKVTPRAFTMGAPDNDSARKSNEHQLAVDFSRSFWVSQHEITQAQFQASQGNAGGTNLPVTNVSWQDAAMYTNWLSDKEGLLPFYIVTQGRVVGVNPASRGYRLPTEAEWEFIAKLNRRASPTMYVWGSQAQLRDKQANFADEAMKGQQTFYLRGYSDGFAGLAPVGSFKAERGGFFDLDGNVREWVHDRYTITPPESGRVYTDYLGANRGNSHVVKGASYKTGRMKNIRNSVRSGESAAADDIGFRIARYDE